MPVTVYRSTDSSAPVLTGQVGSLIALLDACLVNGYTGKTALGWAKPFSATNTGVYRAAIGTRQFLAVVDNAVTAGVGREAQVWGYENVTGIGAGTGSFPTSVQQSLGLCWRKSATADATVRAWTLIGDEKTFYLWLNDGGTQTTTNSFGFGEFLSYKASDAYNTFIAGGVTFNASAPASYLMTGTNYGANAPSNCFFLARAFHQMGAALAASCVGPVASGGAYGAGGIAFPNGPDGGTYVGPIYITEPSTGIPIRGRVRGYYAAMHPAPFAMYDTVTNVVGLTGVTLLSILSHSSGTAGQVLLDTTGPW